ncbi:hypothetical protein J7E97_00965 [Streptomyces sp. ISL-66]|uniref:hypothetical protein n=1 Tax=Streptomyces sp. ISL-66 TaxID=2819186 RepID=UPI001BE5A26C|nr:hypothetical protein [Streptomyces sp. ISL-66]MBT2466467.1 hypothetical protein [Streptomyces sp. ISL-66]
MSVRAGDLRGYQRNDIPDVLLSNRFLELFSRDMSDRDGFRPSDGTSDRGEVVVAFNGDHYFHRFELTLPADSSIKGNPDGSLAISGPAFDMGMSVRFEGMAESIPAEYMTEYVNVYPTLVREYEVELGLTVSVRRSLIFGGRRWRYHLWIDSFAHEMSKSFDFKSHLADMNWPMVSAMLHCMRQRPSQDEGPAEAITVAAPPTPVPDRAEVRSEE